MGDVEKHLLSLVNLTSGDTLVSEEERSGYFSEFADLVKSLPKDLIISGANSFLSCNFELSSHEFSVCDKAQVEIELQNNGPDFINITSAQVRLLGKNRLARRIAQISKVIKI